MSVQAVTVTDEDAARRRMGATAAIAALVAALVLISLGIGPVRLSPLAVTEALFGSGSEVSQVIVREIRLPRTLLALAIGAILGLSGASLQGLLRNPLASPSLFGSPQSAAWWWSGPSRCAMSASRRRCVPASRPWSARTGSSKSRWSPSSRTEPRGVRGMDHERTQGAYRGVGP